ncbi:MAG: NAD kinase [Bacteroidota bacterium]
MTKKYVINGLILKNDSDKYFNQITDRLSEEDIETYYTEGFHQRNPNFSNIDKVVKVIPNDCDVVLSLGGDGTFLESVLLVGEKEIPILGINIGRLGFLASIAKEYIKESLYLLFKKRFDIEKRSLVSIETSLNIFDGKCFALNEFAILRKDLSSMIQIKSYINNHYLNTYWADGVMVSTPTGSTGYSLSCGGPLMMPDAKDFVITPVSPHNLNVRPLIVSDDSELKFEIETRERSYLLSLDSRSETVYNDLSIIVKKAPFYGKLIRIEGINFPDTIRNKLGWGFDKRN